MLYQENDLYLILREGPIPMKRREISFFTEWNKNSRYSEIAKTLVTLCILNSLEKVSYTAKGGQYLRWNYRSKKNAQIRAV